MTRDSTEGRENRSARAAAPRHSIDGRPLVLTLFASDLHLHRDRPASLAAFVRLARGAARRAREVYLLGDVFDQWLGDDDTTPPHPEVETELRRLVDAGSGYDSSPETTTSWWGGTSRHARGSSCSTT